MTILLILLIFTFIVMVHELGHFIPSRLFKIPVYEVSVGYAVSPKICTLFNYKETAFTIRLLPIGGFCKYSLDTKVFRPFLNVGFTKHMVILFGGPIFNILIGLLLFIPAYANIKDVSLGIAAIEGLDVFNGIFIDTFSIFINFFDSLFCSIANASVSGPLGIASLIVDGKSMGGIYLIALAGGLSMAFGIMNLLPLPFFDGGNIILLLFEKITNKTCSEKFYYKFNSFGVVILIALLIYATINDVIAFF